MKLVVAEVQLVFVYAIVEERVPGKQGLKLPTRPAKYDGADQSKSEFQENKD